MAPESKILREICSRLGMTTEQVDSVAVTEREEGEDYAAFEIAAICSESLPEWAAKRLFDEFNESNPAIAELLEKVGFGFSELKNSSVA